eukprot:2702037-Lingulodinium_polyedra.AAC.1
MRVPEPPRPVSGPRKSARGVGRADRANLRSAASKLKYMGVREFEAPVPEWGNGRFQRIVREAPS